MNKLKALKKTRQIASKSLVLAIKNALKSRKPISEAVFRDSWLKEIRKNLSLFPDGWYLPPPHGMAVLFGKPSDSRISFKSLRPEGFWPKEDSFLDLENGMAHFYISPVDKETCIIGDYGLTIYFGKDKDVIKHLKAVFNMTKRIGDHAKLGVKLKDLAKWGHNLMVRNEMDSDLDSPTDPTGTNIGHTIPFTYEDMNEEEKGTFKNSKKDWQATLSMISKKRKFLNSIEETEIIPGMAFTVEPRPQVLNNSKIPLVWFHTIVLFNQDGKKEILKDFDSVFKLAGMDYMYA